MGIKNKIIWGGLALCMLASCKKTVQVESDFNLPSVTNPDNPLPTISNPVSSPFYSNSSSLVIEGVCRNGSTIVLAGDGNQTTSCSNQSYRFTINRNVDASYNFRVSQRMGKYETPPKILTWVRKTSVSVPALTTPNSTPYYSASTTLGIQGGCETGARLVLSGDATGEVLCENSQFQINVLKFVDGDYNITVTQIDPANNQAAMSFVWRKTGLTVTPDNPQVRVTESQIFNISGGANSYTATFTSNNSGATFDTNTNTYTAGTVSGVVDTIDIEDSQGFTHQIQVTVIPDVPDHFEFPLPPDPSGNNQNIEVGKDFSQSLVAKVADRFGNAVPNYKVVFKGIAGDLFFKDNYVQTSGADGLVQMNLTQGFMSTRANIVAVPLVGSLPDVNNSSGTFLKFQSISNNNNSGKIGLDFPVGNGAEDTVVQDFDGDGRLDAVVLNKSDQNLSVFLGQDSGILNKVANVNGICNGASSLSSGDLNGDTFQDLLITCTGVSNFYVLTGNGNGTFAPPQATALDGGETLTVDSALGDIDGDGDLDLAIVSVSSAVVSIRMSNGDGTFAAPVIRNTGSSPSKVMLADFDGANGMDIVVMNAASDDVGVYLNDGSSTFAAAPTNYSTGVAPAGLELADFNSDGNEDIAVVSNADTKVSVFLGAGDGTFNLPIDTLVGSSPTDLHALDYNGDNQVDLVVANTGGNSISVLQGLNTGTFSVSPERNTGVTPLYVNSGDFNSDGTQDILVVANGASSLQLIPSKADGSLGLVKTSGNGTLASIGADFDHDGIRDKASINSGDNNITVFKGNGKGDYSLHATLSIGVLNPSSIHGADFNADGLQDIAVTNMGNNTLAVYISRQDGTFENVRVVPTGQQPAKIATGDLNGDGFLDAVVTNSGANNFSFFPGDGTGAFSSRADTTTGSQPTGVQIADFDDDQNLDVILVNQSDGTANVSLFAGNGDGTFKNPANYDAENSPNDIMVGYFNPDAILDVAVSNNISSSVSVFLGALNGGFQAASNYAAGVSPTDLAMADFNGDGNQDIIVSNGLNQKLTVLYGSLSGVFNTSTEFNAGVHAASIDVDDVNNDGAVDVTVVDGTNGAFKILFGH